MEQVIVDDRLKTLRRLSVITEGSFDESTLEQAEAQYRMLHQRFGAPPTIGCEIEVNWSSIFPEEAEHFFGPRDEQGRLTRRYKQLPPEARREFDLVYQGQDAALRLRYEATLEAGVPKGKDGYWEFAHQPAYHWSLLAAETRLLMEDGLIPPQASHSLHVTLGGLAVGRGGAGLIVSGLELLSAPPERIVQATERNEFGGSVGWARRGEMGLRERSGAGLELGAGVATEFRSLVAEGAEQTSETLRAAQLLAGPLAAYRHKSEGFSDDADELASIWPVYRDAIKTLLAERGLPATSPWGHPTHNRRLWLDWASCLERRGDPSSLEFETKHRISVLLDDIETLLASS